MRCKAKSRSVIIALLAIVSAPAAADAIRQTKGDFYDAFRQLDVDLPTPNVYRTASGAPGEKYWQQEASYRIDVRLDLNSWPQNARLQVRVANDGASERANFTLKVGEDEIPAVVPPGEVVLSGITDPRYSTSATVYVGIQDRGASPAHLVGWLFYR